MEQNTNNEKIKSTKIIIISVATVLFSVFVVIGILIYVFLHSFSSSSIKNEFSKYDQKTYSVTSEDGKIQGFIATKIVSCGEFPSDICLNTYYNFLIKEPLDIAKGTITLSNSIGDKGYLQPVYCDADITKINLFKRYDTYSFPFKCETKSSSDISAKAFYSSSLDVFRNSDSLKNIPATGTVKVYDLSNSPRKLIKIYQVTIQPTN